jgi:hypothetical protein
MPAQLCGRSQKVNREGPENAETELGHGFAQISTYRMTQELVQIPMSANPCKSASNKFCP